MKQATEIYRQFFVTKEIDAKEAVKRLNVLFADANGPETAMLTGIYQKILDHEVPETSVDEQTEQEWWDHTHQED